MPSGVARRAVIAAMGVVLCCCAARGLRPAARAAFSRSRRLPVAISRSGPGQVRLCRGQVAGVGQDQADRPVSRAAGGGHRRRGGRRRRVIMCSYHRTSFGGVREPGGDDQAVLAGHVLRVVSLDEPAAADRHQPGVRVGDVPPGRLSVGLLAPRRGRARAASPGPGPLQRVAGGRTRQYSSAGTGCGAGARPPPARRRPPARPRPPPGTRRSPGPAAASARRHLGAPAGGLCARVPSLSVARYARAAARSASARASRSASRSASAAATRSARVTGSPGSSSPRRPVPEQGILPLVSLRVRGRTSRPRASAAPPRSGSRPSTRSRRSSSRPARPSPTWPMPSRAHSTSTCANSVRGRLRELLPEPRHRHVIRHVARRRSPGTPRPARTAARSAATT